jgi:hypothetical protein
VTYAVDQLYAEIAYVAYHFHWPRTEILQLDHHERRRWVREIAEINTRARESG